MNVYVSVFMTFLSLLLVGTSSASECTDFDGDGYGWNGTSTCVPISVIGSCIDDDGDGFGWDGSDTCLVGSFPTMQPTLASNSCIDTDGDGYGWNGVETCIVESIPPTQLIPSIPPTGEGARECAYEPECGFILSNLRVLSNRFVVDIRSGDCYLTELEYEFVNEINGNVLKTSTLTNASRSVATISYPALARGSYKFVIKGRDSCGCLSIEENFDLAVQ